MTVALVLSANSLVLATICVGCIVLALNQRKIIDWIRVSMIEKGGDG